MKNPSEMTLGQISTELLSLGWIMEIEKGEPSPAPGIVPDTPDLPRWILRSPQLEGVSYPQSGGTLEEWFEDALTTARRIAILDTLPDEKPEG